MTPDSPKPAEPPSNQASVGAPIAEPASTTKGRGPAFPDSSIADNQQKPLSQVTRGTASSSAASTVGIVGKPAGTTSTAGIVGKPADTTSTAGTVGSPAAGIGAPAAGTGAPAAGDPNAPAPAEKPKGDSAVAVVAAVVGNILVGIVKFVAAFLSGSAAMFSEGIHSIVDSGNGILVLFGLRQSKKAPDEDHPFGYGKELYFWTLVVAVLIFMVGGGVSLMENISHLRGITPDTQLGDPTLSIAVICIAMVIEGVTLSIAIKQFNRARGDMGPLKFIAHAKDPSLYTVVLEDTAAETGLVLALLGVVSSHFLGNPYLDCIAGICISILLMIVATILLTQTKKLLVGEGLNKPETRQVVEIVESNPYVVDCGRVLSMYMGPDQLLITIDANFNPSASVVQILQAIDNIEADIRVTFPDATRVFIEVESLRQVQAQAQAFEEMESDAEDELLEELAEAEAAKAERDARNSEDDPEEHRGFREFLEDLFDRDEDEEEEAAKAKDFQAAEKARRDSDDDSSQQLTYVEDQR